MAGRRYCPIAAQFIPRGIPTGGFSIGVERDGCIDLVHPSVACCYVSGRTRGQWGLLQPARDFLSSPRAPMDPPVSDIGVGVESDETRSFRDERYLWLP